jgi:hypothetical protein
MYRSCSDNVVTIATAVSAVELCHLADEIGAGASCGVEALPAAPADSRMRPIAKYRIMKGPPMALSRRDDSRRARAVLDARS